MNEKSAYQQQLEDMSYRASQMKRTLYERFANDDGSFDVPSSPEEAKRRSAIMESAIGDTPYALTQSGPMIAAAHTRALSAYWARNKRLPSDDLLASCHKAVENALSITEGRSYAPGIFESANLGSASSMQTTEGVIMRDRLVSLVLPVWLQSITSNMVTFIPGDFNRSEFFRIRRAAGSKFGDYEKGDILDYDYAGVYSAMDQRTLLATGDGSTKTWTLTTSTKFGTAYPLKKERVRVYYDYALVASDTGSGTVSGSFTMGTTAVIVSGTVDYTNGVISVTFSTAPVSGVAIHVGFDVDVEQNSALIPQVDHKMWSRVLFPHESAIAGTVTLQALWAVRRELGQDMENMGMQALRNLLAADKDRKHLRDMLFYAKNVVEWERTVPAALTLREHYETLSAALLKVDTVLMNANGVAGLSGLVGGNDAVNCFRYLGSPFFEMAPGYRSMAQPHYVGKIFGYDLYCDPKMDTWDCLCYAKGPNHGETAYVVGDAVPALTFRHPIMGDLVQRMTMWDLSYRDLQPFDGADYLCRLKFVVSES